MFDLNEAPDPPFVEACVGDCPKDISAAQPRSPGSVVGNGTQEEISLSGLSVPPPSSSSKEDGQNPLTEEAASVVENPISKCLVPSSQSSEVASARQRSDNISCTAQQEATATDAAGDTANASESLGLSLRDESLLDKQTDVDKVDLSNDGCKVAFHFLVGSSGNAGTSHQSPDLASATSVQEQDSLRAGTILLANKEFDAVGPSDRSGLCLSLGGIFHSDSRNPTFSNSKAKLLNASGPCEPETSALLRKTSDLSPFWHGKLCTSDTSMKVPVMAFCLGTVTPDSRLEKLPSVLVPKKFLNLEELEKTLLKGAVEPLIQFKPSCEASSEEIKVFSSLVTTFSFGWEPLQTSSRLSSLAVQQEGQSTSSAALISWDCDSPDATFCLTSLSSMQAVLKECKSSTFVHAFEDVSLLDPESLYGIFYPSTTVALNINPDFLRHLERAVKVAPLKQSERSLEGTLASDKMAGDILIANLSNKEPLGTRPEFLSKSVSLQPLQRAGRDDSKLDSEEAVIGSKRRYEKQLSSSDRVREANSKHHSKNSGARNIEENDKGHRGIEQGHSRLRDKPSDSAKQGSRQNWQSDRLKDSLRRGKDDKDSSKHRTKEHHRHRDEEDKLSKPHRTGEYNRDQDKLHSKGKERLIKESVIEGSRLRSSTEKTSHGLKSKASLPHRTSLDHECSMWNRKRDREDEKGRAVCGKRQKELGVNNHLKLPMKGSSIELKDSAGVLESIHDQSPERECGSVKGSDPPKACNSFQTLDSLHETFDNRISTMDIDPSSAVPEGVHGTVDNASKEPCEIGFSLLGGMSTIPLSLFVERSELIEDRAPSAPCEVLGDPLIEKIEKCNEEKDTSSDCFLEVSDKETRTWLLSKHSILYLEEEYGISATITSDLTNSDVDAKIDLQIGPLIVRISGKSSVPCDMAEEKWFREQALATVKSIASRGVFIKCFWYEGPVQIHPGDGAPSVPIIVKKIKGEDGKNLERIQDLTGVMIGVVLRKCGSGEPLSRPRFIGLRLKCVRRKGLLDASKEAEALLECVADHFSKELANHIATHIVDLQAPALHLSETTSNQSSPLVPAIATREFLPNLPVKDETSRSLSRENEAAVSPSVLRIDGKFLLPKEDIDGKLSGVAGGASRPLCVTDLLDHFAPMQIPNTLENVLRQKLEPWTNLDHISDLHSGATASGKREEERNSRIHEAIDNVYDSDCLEEKWVAENATIRPDPYPGRPRPLFLSELMRNASAPVIKQLFEEIITSYISPNLGGAGGRQLVLDVRYVPSRGCAFVDLATPELVEFMLDLHSRRPDVFKHMKMELGRKPIPYAVDEDTGGRLNLRLHGKSHFSSQLFGYRLSLASRKKMEKRTNETLDMEDSDKADDPQWLCSRMKKQRSDPEKTIYVDRLPENSSEGTIKKIFERVLLQKVAQEELEAVGAELITEVRHVPSKYCAFVVFATEDLTRTVLQLYNDDEVVFESMRLKPHFHSRMEDLYKDELQEMDEIVHTPSLRERIGSLDSDNVRVRNLDLHDSRARSAAHRAITASAFREVDRRRSVYVDRIPDDLSESTMTDIFEKAFRFKKHAHGGHMVSQVAYFRDKFDPSKLCAFVEVKTESGTQDLVDYYNENSDAFRGMRVRPGFKYHN